MHDPGSLVLLVRHWEPFLEWGRNSNSYMLASLPEVTKLQVLCGSCPKAVLSHFNVHAQPLWILLKCRS